MNVQKLVKMANEIAAFFASEPDASLRLAGVAGHLRRFWDPRMRRELLAYVDGGGEGLSDLARAAIEKHKEELRPAA